MHPDAAGAEIVFTAVGVVTSDPASVESVLNWAAALRGRRGLHRRRERSHRTCRFSELADERKGAEEFRKRFQPSILRLDCRLADLENALSRLQRHAGAGSGQDRYATRGASLAGDAETRSYRRQVFAQFDMARAASPMKTAAELIEIRRPDPDLIDRIANALPEEIRAEYYHRTPPPPLSSRQRRDAPASCARCSFWCC